jgi:hypothetical protein
MSNPEPAGVPAGGDALSGDDLPTGNDGTAGSDALAGDAGIASDDPITGEPGMDQQVDTDAGIARDGLEVDNPAADEAR